MTEQEKINKGYIDLCMAVIRRSFIRSDNWQLNKYNGHRNDDIKREFVRNGKFIEMFADCTDNFEAEKIKKLILNKIK